MVLCIGLVKTAWALALDVKPESLTEIGRLSNIQAGVGEVIGPPVSILNAHANPVWPLEYDSSI